MGSHLGPGIRCPPGSAPALLAGNLPLRYCAAKFAGGKPTWLLPAHGQVCLLAAGGEEVVKESD